MANDLIGDIHFSDVFVSYKREERGRVLPLINRLRSFGLSVWFDAALEAGVEFDEEILRELSHARVHLVCWTAASVESRWIRSEAAIGASRNILVPIFLEPCQPRPPFNIDHTEDLSDWNGQHTHEGWLKVLNRIGQLTNRGGALRAWEAAGENPSISQLRAFLSGFPNDPLAPGCRQRVFHLELYATRAKLMRELGIDDTDALPEISELQRDLDSTREELKLVRADAIESMAGLKKRLAECNEKLELSTNISVSLTKQLENQSLEISEALAERQALHAQTFTITKELSLVQKENVHLTEDLDEAMTELGEFKRTRMPDAPNLSPALGDISPVSWFFLSSVMAGMVSSSFMVGGDIFKWIAVVLFDFTKGGADWLRFLGSFGAIILGATAGASELLGRIIIVPGRWLRLATRSTFAIFYIILAAIYMYMQSQGDIEPRGDYGVHALELGLTSAFSFVVFLFFGSAVFSMRRTLKENS